MIKVQKIFIISFLMFCMQMIVAGDNQLVPVNLQQPFQPPFLGEQVVTEEGTWTCDLHSWIVNSDMMPGTFPVPARVTETEQWLIEHEAAIRPIEQQPTRRRGRVVRFFRRVLQASDRFMQRVSVFIGINDALPYERIIVNGQEMWVQRGQAEEVRAFLTRANVAVGQRNQVDR